MSDSQKSALAQLRAKKAAASRGRGRGGARRTTGRAKGGAAPVRVIKKKKASKTQQQEEEQQQQPEHTATPEAGAGATSPEAAQEEQKKKTPAAPAKLDYRNVAAVKDEEIVVPESKPLGDESEPKAEAEKEKEEEKKEEEKKEEEEKAKEPEAPQVVSSPLDNVPGYIDRVRELSIASKACREFLAGYRKADQWNTVAVPITQVDLKQLTEPPATTQTEEETQEGEEGEETFASVFEVIAKHDLKAVALVGTRFFNDELSHLLTDPYNMRLTEDILKPLGERLGGITSLTFDAVPIREEQAEQLAAHLPNLEHLRLIGWIAAEEPRAPIKLQNVIPFKTVQHLTLDRVKFNERFLKLVSKSIEALKSVSIVCYRNEGAYQHLGARPNTFIHQLESDVPNVAFKGEESTAEFTISQEQKDVLNKLRAKHGPAPVQGKYVPPSQRGVGGGAGGGLVATVADLALDSEVSFPSLGDALKEEEEAKKKKQQQEQEQKKKAELKKKEEQEQQQQQQQQQQEAAAQAQAAQAPQQPQQPPAPQQPPMRVEEKKEKEPANVYRPPRDMAAVRPEPPREERRTAGFGFDREDRPGFGDRGRGFGDREERRGFGDRDRGFGGARGGGFGDREERRGFGDRDRGFGGARGGGFGDREERRGFGDRDRGFGRDERRTGYGFNSRDERRSGGFGGDRERGPPPQRTAPRTGGSWR